MQCPNAQAWLPPPLPPIAEPTHSTWCPPDVLLPSCMQTPIALPPRAAPTPLHRPPHMRPPQFHYPHCPCVPLPHPRMSPPQDVPCLWHPAHGSLPPKLHGGGRSPHSGAVAEAEAQGVISAGHTSRVLLTAVPHVPTCLMGHAAGTSPCGDSSWCQRCPCPILLLPQLPQLFWQPPQPELMGLEAGWCPQLQVPALPCGHCPVTHTSWVCLAPSSGAGWWWPCCPAQVPVPMRHRAPPAPWRSHTG